MKTHRSIDEGALIPELGRLELRMPRANVLIFICLAGGVGQGCSAAVVRVAATTDYEYATPDPWRPRFHLTPGTGWMNDPNGLIRYETHGEAIYSIWYQFSPIGPPNEGNSMTWGQAISHDLLHYHRLPASELEPGSGGLSSYYSGSAVVVAPGSPRSPCPMASDSSPCIVSMYTYATTIGFIQVQRLAYTNDGGQNWYDLEDVGSCDATPSERVSASLMNPQLALGFRDPRLFRWPEDEGGGWGAVISDVAGVQIWQSSNLHRWCFKSRFDLPKRDDEESGVVHLVEMPDLFPIDVDSPTPGAHEQVWVLKWDVNTSPPFLPSRSTARAMFGTFHSGQFLPISAPARVDWGDDFYAAQTFFDGGSPPVWIGWLSNWRYATSRHFRDRGWSGLLSVPRLLHAKRDAGGTLHLIQVPVPLTSLWQETTRDPVCDGEHEPCSVGSNESIKHGGVIPLHLRDGNGQPAGAGAADIDAVFRLEDSTCEVGLFLRGDGHAIILGYQRGMKGACDGQEVHVSKKTCGGEQAGDGGTLFVRRQFSFNPLGGSIDVPELRETREAPVTMTDGVLHLHVIVDTTSLEIFGEEGAVVISNLVEPHDEDDLYLYAIGGTVQVQKLDVHTLRASVE